MVIPRKMDDHEVKVTMTMAKRKEVTRSRCRESHDLTVGDIKAIMVLDSVGVEGGWRFCNLKKKMCMVGWCISNVICV